MHVFYVRQRKYLRSISVIQYRHGYRCVNLREQVYCTYEYGQRLNTLTNIVDIRPMVVHVRSFGITYLGRYSRYSSWWLGVSQLGVRIIVYFCMLSACITFSRHYCACSHSKSECIS